VVRPLVWSFQDDVDCWRVDDEFTVGPSLLVAPILNNNPDRDVYLPAGGWRDFWEDAEIIRGPVTTHWFKGWTAVNRFPLYIRDGAIIPLEVTNDVTGFGWAESAGCVTLAIWPKAAGSSEFTLHDTEGPVRIVAGRKGDELEIHWDATRRNHLLRVHLDSSSPNQVFVADGPLVHFGSIDMFRRGGEGWYFDVAAHKLWIRKLNHGAPETIHIALEKSQ
jgi:alpha-D-xyloside xylohydrolase